MAGFAAVGRVLAQRNARVFYAGSLICWTGLWMQRVAVEWLTWQLTHSPLWVGIMAFCNLGPAVLMSPLAGAAADRMDRVRLTMSTQMVACVHGAALATLVMTGLIEIHVMAALEVVLGLAQTIAQPARQTLIPGLVGRADLPGAVALNSLTYNLARFSGPALAGPIIALWGVVPAMLANSASYAFASLTMPLLRLAPGIRRGHKPTASVWREAIEGIRYVVRHAGMAPLLLYAAVLGSTMRAVPETLPPFVAELFGRGAPGLATLASTMGLGALVGGVGIALHGKLQGLCRIAVWSGLAMVLSTGGFVATHSFPFAVGCASVMGCSATLHGISVSTLIQTNAEGPMIGRVLSLWGMITRAGPALGALVFGVSSEFVGLQLPVLVACALCLAACAWAMRRMGGMARVLERSPG